MCKGRRDGRLAWNWGCRCFCQHCGFEACAVSWDGDERHVVRRAPEPYLSLATAKPLLAVSHLQSRGGGGWAMALIAKGPFSSHRSANGSPSSGFDCYRRLHLGLKNWTCRVWRKPLRRRSGAMGFKELTGFAVMLRDGNYTMSQGDKAAKTSGRAVLCVCCVGVGGAITMEWEQTEPQG